MEGNGVVNHWCLDINWINHLKVNVIGNWRLCQFES